ncbi:hypothetical protein PGB90_005045 [Kerria lacca]
MPRSPSDNLKKLGFSLVKTPDNKYNAYCSVCEKNLCNTAALRLRAHRNKCKMKGYENIENISYIEENVPKLKKENCESIIYCNTNDEAEIAVQIVDVESITKDECIAFGQYISAQLKKLDQKTFAIVKYKISEVLYNAEMGNFSEM